LETTCVIKFNWSQFKRKTPPNQSYQHCLGHLNKFFDSTWPWVNHVLFSVGSDLIPLTRVSIESCSRGHWPRVILVIDRSDMSTFHWRKVKTQNQKNWAPSQRLFLWPLERYNRSGPTTKIEVPYLFQTKLFNFFFSIHFNLYVYLTNIQLRP